MKLSPAMQKLSYTRQRRHIIRILETGTLEELKLLQKAEQDPDLDPKVRTLIQNLREEYYLRHGAEMEQNHAQPPGACSAKQGDNNKHLPKKPSLDIYNYDEGALFGKHIK